MSSSSSDKIVRNDNNENKFNKLIDILLTVFGAEGLMKTALGGTDSQNFIINQLKSIQSNIDLKNSNSKRMRKFGGKKTRKRYK